MKSTALDDYLQAHGIRERVRADTSHLSILTSMIQLHYSGLPTEPGTGWSHAGEGAARGHSCASARAGCACCWHHRGWRGRSGVQAPVGRPGHQKCHNARDIMPPWPGPPGRRAKLSISKKGFDAPVACHPSAPLLRESLILPPEQRALFVQTPINSGFPGSLGVC